MSGTPNAKLDKKLRENAKLARGLLQEEKESTEDLEYWIDYIHLFGVAHKIPKYDHMNFIRLHNLDVFAFLFAVIYIIYSMFKFCICKCCCSKKAVDESLR